MQLQQPDSELLEYTCTAARAAVEQGAAAVHIMMAGQITLRKASGPMSRAARLLRASSKTCKPEPEPEPEPGLARRRVLGRTDADVGRAQDLPR